MTTLPGDGESSLDLISGQLRLRCSADAAACKSHLRSGRSSSAFLEEFADKRASDWLQGVRNGWPECQWLAGLCFLTGLGVAQDRSEAVRLLGVAAAQNHAEAQNALGACFSLGFGVQQDKIKAIQMFRLAADNGSCAGQLNLGLQFINATEPDKQAEGFAWILMSAEQGNTAAQLQLANCLQHGVGVARSSIMAAKWFQKAAGGGLALPEPFKDIEKIDLDFRPENYWPFAHPDAGQSTNEAQRIIREAIQTGDLSRVRVPIIPFALRGGDFLPPFELHEVEVARISLDSSTWDVISVRARPTNTTIVYRVVDEYSTVFKLRRDTSERPLSLGEMIELLDQISTEDGVWSPFNLRRDGGPFDDEPALRERFDFVHVSSDFYPDLARWYDMEAAGWLAWELGRLPDRE